MRVWEIHGAFGLENLKLVEREKPRAGHGQIVIRVKAASLNYRDLLMVRGHYNPRQPLPLIPCSDGAGEVVEVGEGVTGWEVGDRAAPIFSQTWQSGEPSRDKLRGTLGGPIDGMLAEYVCVSADGAVKPPDNLSDAEVSTLPCAALTAWSALVEQGSVKAGDVILVQGTGGVSMFALQFGVMLGARVIATSSSDEKLERVKQLGAAHTINYKDEPDWGKVARKLAGGDGVDHIVEVGGANTLEQSLKAIRPGGHISMIGVLSGTRQKLDIIPILMQNIRVQGILVGHREGFVAMNRAIEANGITPVISDTFAFEDAPAAFELMANAGHFGKIVVAF
ncbi:MAG: NAD(P)-dependent alcohol dehydrogenase [Myxococcota bacterium]|nr:NAD(P)-dependent alcohol dehydrogenase [Myxococcota bacterium]MEC9442045.1 NAD(P)-dependent alcohol dehydrogenase [Myxococcota bacterium]